MLLRRAVVACVLLCTAPLLAACGEDENAAVKVKDVIPANDEDQFERGRAAEVVIPVGRLKVWLGKPTDEVAREDTRQLEGLTAPDGATFVPITWRYSDGFEEATDFLGDAPPATMELVTDGERYRLPTPDETEEGGESFYVVVDGDAEDLVLEVGFDGVTQTLDLRTGKRDEGRARRLYRLEIDRLRPKDCLSAGWVDDDPLVTINYVCDTTGPLLLPYANGEWARPGRQWLTIRVQTTLRQWGVVNGLGGSAIYGAVGTRLVTTLAGDRPAVTHEQPEAACPVAGVGTCVVDLNLIFDVAADDVPDELEIDQRFDLSLVSQFGVFSPKKRMRGDVSGTVSLALPDLGRGGREHGDRERRGRRRD